MARRYITLNLVLTFLYIIAASASSDRNFTMKCYHGYRLLDAVVVETLVNHHFMECIQACMLQHDPSVPR